MLDNRHLLRAGTAWLTLTLGLLAPTGAVAQSEQALLSDIIVTATRRAQALSDVPIAVSAITADRLLDSGTTDIRSLNQLAPSLLVSGATNEQVFSARVRGVGTVGENAGIESSVALFIDGVYRSRTGTGLTDLGEVERIEVLRGPQGTLFGRNASAGLINVVTKAPAFENYVYANATYGNYDQKRLEGGINAELIRGKLAGKLEGLWNKRDGYIEDIASDRSFNNRNRWMLRGQLLYEPDDDLSLRLIGDYTNHREQCCRAGIAPSPGMSRDAEGNVVFGPNPLLPILQGLGSLIEPGEMYRTAVTPGRNVPSEVDSWGVSAELNWDLGAAKLTSITAYRDFKSLGGLDVDYDNLDIMFRTGMQQQFKTFTQELRFQGQLFDDRLDWLVGGYFSDEKFRSWGDDIQYGADAEAYGDCLIVAALAPASLNTALPRCTTLPATAWPGFAGLAAALGVPGLPGTGAGPGSYYKHNSRNYAFFTHNVFDIVPDRLSLTVGARWTHERKTLETVFNNTNELCSVLRGMANPAASFACVVNGTAGPGFAAGDPGTKISESRWTGTVVLDWKPTDDLMLYGSWARGYKAGGFNLDSSAVDITCNPNAGTPDQQAACAAQLALPPNTVGNARPEAVDLQFAPETVESFEIGAKYAVPGFSASLALFRQKFSNFQLNTYNGVNFEVTNIQACRDDLGGADMDTSPLTGACAPDRLKAGVVSKGIELELAATPVQNLNVTAALTYLDTAFSRNLVGTNGRPLSPVLFQLPGRQISNAPPYVVTGSVSWTPPIGDNLRGLFYLDYRFQSNTNTGSNLDIEKIQQAYVVFNGRVGISSVDRKWSLELWGQNLFNKKYFQIAADQPLHGSGSFRAVADGRLASANKFNVLFPGEPRMYGVTGRVRF